MTHSDIADWAVVSGPGYHLANPQGLAMAVL
jgi:hypothetical protein